MRTIVNVKYCKKDPNFPLSTARSASNHLYSNNKNSTGDGHAHFVIIVDLAFSIWQNTIDLLEDKYQVRCCGEVFLRPVSPQRHQVGRPLYTHPFLVIDFLLMLYNVPNLRFHKRIRYRDEGPWFCMRATGCGA